MTERKDDFDFYLNFAKQLILSLADVKDRILASAWVQKLRDQQVGPVKLRTDYLKLLLFSLQRKHLVGPFAQNPADLQILEDFSSSFKLHDIAKALIEEEYAENQLHCSGDSPPISGECSADLLEYAASQDIPNFGAHLYYAISNEPIHKWTRLQKAIYPKQEVEHFDKTTVASVSVTTHATSVVHSEIVIGDSVSQTTKHSKSKIQGADAVSPKRTPRASSPVVSALGDKPEDEEPIRKPPTWGSNLFSVTEPPERDFTVPELNLDDYCEIEGVNLEQLRKDLQMDVDCVEFDENAGNEECEDFDEDFGKEDECKDDSFGSAEDMNFDINFGIMPDKEFDDYIEMLKKQEEELMADLGGVECPPVICPPEKKKKQSPQRREPSPQQQRSSPKVQSICEEIDESKKVKRDLSKSKLQKPGFISKLKRPDPVCKAEQSVRDENDTFIRQGSIAAKDIIQDANKTIQAERMKIGKKSCSEEADLDLGVDRKNEGISIRHKVDSAVRDAKRSLHISPAFNDIPVTTPRRSPSPERITNIIGDAEFSFEDEILSEDKLDTDWDRLQPLTTMQKVQMEVPLDVRIPCSPQRDPLSMPSTSRVPTPKYVPPTQPRQTGIKKGKASAKTIRTVDVEAFGECFEPDTADPSETITVQLKHRKLLQDKSNSPQSCLEYESFNRSSPKCRSPSYSPSTPKERLIPQFEYTTPPKYNQPPTVRRKSPPFSRLAAASSREGLISLESIDLYESPTHEQSMFSPHEEEQLREQRECYERQLFEESDALTASIFDEEQLEFEEIMSPEEQHAFEVQSELRQMPCRYQSGRRVPVEQQRRSNVNERQNLANFPRVPPQLRGKTTRRCYGQPPKVDTIKEYYEGPTEPIYQSPRRKVPPVYPSVVTPPSAERDPCVYPETYRFERSPSPSTPKYNYAETPRTSRPGRGKNRANMRPRQLDFDEEEVIPCEPPPYRRTMPVGEETGRRMRKLDQMFPSQSSSLSDEQVRELMYERPRPSDLITFKLGEYDYYVSPTKESVLDQDNPQWGLQKPLIPYEYGWKSPPNLRTTPRHTAPNKTTIIKILPGGNTIRINEEQIPYADWAYEESEWPSEHLEQSPPSPGKPPPRRATHCPESSDTTTIGKDFPLDQEMEYVENLLEEYQQDMDEQQQCLLPEATTSRGRQLLQPQQTVPSPKKRSPTAVTKDTTPTLVAARRVALQRELFNTFNELDDLFNDNAEAIYHEEGVSPLSQPLNLYKFREHVRTKGRDARYDKNEHRSQRRRNLARSFSVNLPEYEIKEEDCGTCYESPACYKPPNPNSDYYTVLGIDDDVELTDYCD